MNFETMYTLGQVTRCTFPEGAEPKVLNVIVVKPAAGQAKIMRSTAAKRAGDDLARLVSRLPSDLADPAGGLAPCEQGPF